MKGKINKVGMLLIERGGKLKPQECPYSQNEVYCAECGDWCPLFGEPHDKYADNFGRTGAMMTICQDRGLSFTEFTDERVSHE